MDLESIANDIQRARAQRELLDPVTDRALFPLDDAYAVQEQVLAGRLSRGEHHVGWKIGYTSAAMREQMGIAEPNFGPLTDAMVLRDGDSVPPGLLDPRVEPEILVVLERPVDPAMSREMLRDSCREVRCALEVVDPIWRDYRFRIEDNTADGSSAAHVVLGTPVGDATALDAIAVELELDGEVQHRATTHAVMGHPLEALRWLAGALEARGRTLAPGHLVMTGGLTATVELARGTAVRARFDGVGDVTVRRDAD